jgi:hypothetical protein
VNVTCRYCHKTYKWTPHTASGCAPCLRTHAKPIETLCLICGERTVEGMYCNAHLAEMRDAAKAKGLRDARDIARENRKNNHIDSSGRPTW